MKLTGGKSGEVDMTDIRRPTIVPAVDRRVVLVLREVMRFIDELKRAPA
jgi:hypothetical protein